MLRVEGSGIDQHASGGIKATNMQLRGPDSNLDAAMIGSMIGSMIGY
jgi:hypothetical protein